MADKRNILPAHKVRQEKIAGRKIRMPPLNHHHIRLFAPDIARCSHDIERIRRMEPVLRILYFETVVTVVPLFLVKKKFRILHLVGDHLHIVPLRQLPICWESRMTPHGEAGPREWPDLGAGPTG